MAELATGMMIICLPTLPALLSKCRKRHQGKSSPWANGDSSSRRANTPRLSRKNASALRLNNGLPFSNIPVKPCGDGARFLGAGHHVGSITNDIQGGQSLSEGASPNNIKPTSKEILKTVTVTQTRV